VVRCLIISCYHSTEVKHSRKKFKNQLSVVTNDQKTKTNYNCYVEFYRGIHKSVSWTRKLFSSAIDMRHQSAKQSSASATLQAPGHTAIHTSSATLQAPGHTAIHTSANELNKLRLKEEQHVTTDKMDHKSVHATTAASLLHAGIHCLKGYGQPSQLVA